MNYDIKIISDIVSNILIENNIECSTTIISNISKLIELGEMPTHDFLSALSNSIYLDMDEPTISVGIPLRSEPNSTYLDMSSPLISILQNIATEVPIHTYLDMDSPSLTVLIHLGSDTNSVYLDMNSPTISVFGKVTIGGIGHVTIGSLIGKTIQEIMYQEIG